MGKIKNMSPKQIKNSLQNVGITPSGIARALSRSPTQISRVINGEPSHPVRTHIAMCINMSVKDIWPETYLMKKNPTKKGRPLTSGLNNNQSN